MRIFSTIGSGRFTALVTLVNFVILAVLLTSATGVLISNNAGSAHNSAALEVRSSSQGFLPPVLTTTQRNAIANPATGLQVYNSTNGQHETYNGTLWEAIGAGNTTGSSPTGTIVAYGGSTIPSGWLECNGDDISRANYANLFTAIGTAWGYGDQSTTFNLPDLRGMFLRGHDNSRGEDPNAGSRVASKTGGNTGDNVGSYQGYAFQSHRHYYTRHDDNPSSGQAYAGGGYLGNALEGTYTGYAGGNETRPENVYVKYIIKY
ncbi:MAG: tail fiber protein [Bacteroidia bacterium]